jgi:hypothetical protein
VLLAPLLLSCRYTRANAPTNSPNVTIYAGNYKNINPLDFPTADKIWGQYSQRYDATHLVYTIHVMQKCHNEPMLQ